MRRVPVGRRNLFSDRRRALLGIVGVGVAFLLVLLLDGIVKGAMRQVTRYIDTSQASVFVAQRGVTNMHMASSSVPLSELDRILEVPGVDWADPILFAPDALAADGGRQTAYVIGYVPGGRGGPISLVTGREPGTGEIVIDRAAAASLELEAGEDVRVLGRTWRVSGLTEGLTNLANTVAFARFADVAATRGLQDTASYLLAGGPGPADVLAGRIASATGLSALSRESLADSERRLVRDMSAEVMQVMSFSAFAIGLAVIALTLYATTVSRLREIGVLKALGADRRRLADIVLSQAMWTIGVAVVLAVVLAAGLGALFSGGTLSVVVEAPSVVRAVAAGVLLGALGALAPVIRVWRVDPASVFRR